MLYQNFNPYGYYRDAINIPRTRSYINPLNGRKNVSLKTMINNAERSVDTISSIIPLYKKVKPVLDQGKTILSSITSYFTKKEVTNKNNNVEHVDVEIVNENINKTSKEDSFFDYRNTDDNSKPFFI